MITNQFLESGVIPVKGRHPWAVGRPRHNHHRLVCHHVPTLTYILYTEYSTVKLLRVRLLYLQFLSSTMISDGSYDKTWLPFSSLQKLI